MSSLCCATGLLHRCPQTIINHGADVNAINKFNTTALMLACGKSNKDAINVLVNAGADTNISNVDGNTWLHHAAHGDCSKEVLQTIICHGTDVNATNKYNQTSLMLACKDGGKDFINVLLNAGADPSITDVDNQTSLHHAAGNDCCTEVYQEIISHGVDVNATAKNNVSALMIACEKGNKYAINVLLSAGANPNIADANSETSLHYAAGNDCCTEVLHAIISHGADVNATDKSKTTALMLACERGDKDAISVLLNAGADPNLVDADGYTCLHDLASAGCTKEVFVAVINHGADVNVTNKNNITALMRACLEGNKDAIIMLLNAGADPNITDEDGNVCLHYAAQNECCTEVLMAIIRHDVDVNATGKNNTTALMLVCGRGDKNAINVLLNAGADPNITDDNGNACFHYLYYAAQHDCCTDVLQTIINHGADVNAINKLNNTTLMLACGKGNTDDINVLVNAGADTNISNVEGNTWLHHAAHGVCSKEVLQAIICHGTDVNATNKCNQTSLMLACKDGGKDFVNVLLDAGADPNIADANSETSLHYAAGNDCCIEVYQEIISHGVDVNATAKNNVSALMLACEKGNKYAINVLLNAGADPNIADANSGTSLHYAAGNDCCIEVYQEIISHGVDVNATAKNNVSALMLACEKGNKDAINVLLNAGADPNIADANSETSLHYAAGNDCCTEVYQEIISHGVDVNATAKNNLSALLLACEKGNKDAINVLFNAGADPNIATANGKTCLHCVAQHDCCTDVLHAIISHGVDVNARKKNNVTALMKACANGNVDAIEVLLHAGADPNIMDDAGDTCLHNAAQGACAIHDQDFQSFIDHYCTGMNGTNMANQSAFVLLHEAPGVSAVSVLLRSLTDSNIADTKGYNLLCDPISNHISKELLLTVTERGAELHVLKSKSAAAQLFTCNKKHKESMKAILRSGADTTIANIFGDTCLHEMLLREYLSLEYDHEALQMLLDHGAPVNALNKNHQTAYMFAYGQGNIDAMYALVNAGADQTTPEIYDGLYRNQVWLWLRSLPNLARVIQTFFFHAIG